MTHGLFFSFKFLNKTKSSAEKGAPYLNVRIPSEASSLVSALIIPFFHEKNAGNRDRQANEPVYNTRGNRGPTVPFFKRLMHVIIRILNRGQRVGICTNGPARSVKGIARTHSMPIPLFQFPNVHHAGSIRGNMKEESALRICIRKANPGHPHSNDLSRHGPAVSVCRISFLSALDFVPHKIFRRKNAARLQTGCSASATRSAIVVTPSRARWSAYRGLKCVRIKFLADAFAANRAASAAVECAFCFAISASAV